MKSRKIIFAGLLIIASILLISNLILNSDESQSNPEKKNDDLYPKIGLVPDSATAVKIAEAIMFPILKNKTPSSFDFSAKLLKDSIWWVGLNPKELQLGGSWFISISKKDCRVLDLYGTK
jgi:NTF2 fold immunity protein